MVWLAPLALAQTREPPPAHEVSRRLTEVRDGRDDSPGREEMGSNILSVVQLRTTPRRRTRSFSRIRCNWSTIQPNRGPAPVWARAGRAIAACRHSRFPPNRDGDGRVLRCAGPRHKALQHCQPEA